MIYNFYIFDKQGNLLYYQEWTRLKQSGITCEEEAKLMYGMIYSMKSFVNKISPTDIRDGYIHYKTNKNALHILETSSGLKFVMNTDTASTGVKEFMNQFYLKIWLEYVVKNPFCLPEKPITSELFKAKCDEFIKQSTFYGGIKSV
ncbi:trafficking protein particle complex subunit 1 [Lutzomyia longipalpis]|uniref:trafficking protein particle complex subunit 1 n=1 Tax=Lutzomyia longipalpis TaxID=7200 RepID=UPI0024835DC0|nr:trafficking protein particle complex subunit 1 [Lutzomyia longipalpis]